MIRVSDVTKRHGEGRGVVDALRGVSLAVSAGEFVAIMGPSGSGKSTLLHLIAGLDSPTSGEIWIAGKDLGAMSDDQVTMFRRRNVGVVFQFFHLLPTLTVEENIALPLALDGIRPRDSQGRVRALLERTGLGGRGDHRADQLSGGEMQRVALARALVIDPAILVADEPTGNLDSETGDQVLALMRELIDERKCAAVMVTHDAHASARADRVVVLKDGRIESETAAPVVRAVPSQQIG